jgi:hypothetical protein
LRRGKTANLVGVVGLDFDLIHVGEEVGGYLAKHFRFSQGLVVEGVALKLQFL